MEVQVGINSKELPHGNSFSNLKQPTKEINILVYQYFSVFIVTIVTASCF
mgnify:CR=1 FL=1